MRVMHEPPCGIVVGTPEEGCYTMKYVYGASFLKQDSYYKVSGEVCRYRKDAL